MYDRLVSKARLTKPQSWKFFSAFLITDYAALTNVDLVIEAVFEDIAEKTAPADLLVRLVAQGRDFSNLNCTAPYSDA